MERYHLTQGLYCPGGTISVSKDKSKKQPKWPPGKFLVETLADAMKVDLTNSTQRSMQPQFDFLFQEWGPPVMADIGGPNLTMPENVTTLPYPNRTAQKVRNEEWSNQPQRRFLAFRELAWRLADAEVAHSRRKYALLIDRRDAYSAARRHLDPGFAENASLFFTARGVELRVASLMTMDIKAQIQLFAHAAIIIGIHGAGLANMIFSQESHGFLIC